MAITIPTLFYNLLVIFYNFAVDFIKIIENNFSYAESSISLTINNAMVSWASDFNRYGPWSIIAFVAVLSLTVMVAYFMIDSFDLVKGVEGDL